MISVGAKQAIAVKGDYRPVEITVGGKRVAGWQEQTVDGLSLCDTTGAVVSISDAAAKPVVSLTSHITAVQEGTGDPSPDNVRPIVGWDSVSVAKCGRNLVDIPDYIETNANVIRLSTIPIFEAVKYKDNTQYTLSADITMTATDSWFGASIDYTDGTHEYARMAGKYNNNPYTTAPDKTVASITYTYDVNVIVTVKNTHLQEGATATPYEPYTGETHTRALPETVYGGTLDWRTGLLTVDRAKYVVTGNENWNKNNQYKRWQASARVEHASAGTSDKGNIDVICTHAITALGANSIGVWVVAESNGNLGLRWMVESDKDFADADALKVYLAEQYAAGTPMEYVYKIATPYTIQLTPQQLSMLRGHNTVWSDCGDTSLTYKVYSEVEGVTEAEFADTYNDRAALTVQGTKLEQVSTTGINLMPPLMKGIEINSSTGAENSTSKVSAATDFVPWNGDTAILTGMPITLNNFVAAYDANKVYLARTGASKYTKRTLTLGAFDGDASDVAYIRLTVYATTATSGTMDDIDAAQIQMELGDTATDYEPYSGGYASPSPDWPQPIHGTEAAVTVSNADTEPAQTTLPVLYGRDGVCDVLETDVVVDGVHRSRVTRRWQTLALTGDEEWEESEYTPAGESYTRYDANGISDKYPIDNLSVMCSHYPNAGRVNGRGVWVSKQYGCDMRIAWEYDTAEELTSYLAAQYAAGTPVTVVYQLAEPVIELGDPIDIRTLPRSTIIGSTDPVSMIVKTVDRSI